MTAKIRCPHCGSPVMIRGSRWECGYCGDFGSISSLQLWEKTKVLRSAAPAIQGSISVEEKDEVEETSRHFSRVELENMIRRWDFAGNEWAFRDLLIAAFPQAVDRWQTEELAGMDAMDLLVLTGKQDPETAISMMKLLLDTAQENLQNPEAAELLLGYELYDLCLLENIWPNLLAHLQTDERLAQQLFQSAYVGSPQEDILLSCAQRGEGELQKKLLVLLVGNPYPHDEIELGTGEN